MIPILFVFFALFSCENLLSELEDDNNLEEQVKADESKDRDKTKSSPADLYFSTPTLDFENYNLGDFAWVTFVISNKGDAPSPQFQLRFFTSLDQERDESDTLVASTIVGEIPAQSFAVVSNDVQLKYTTNITDLDWYTELYLGYYLKDIGLSSNNFEKLGIKHNGEGFLRFAFPKFQTRKVVQLPQDGPFYFLDSVALANISPNSAFADEIIYTYSGDDVDDPGLYYAKIQTTDYNSIAFAKIQEDAYGTPSIANWNTNNDLLEMGIAEKQNNIYSYFYNNTFGTISSSVEFLIANLLFNVPYDTDDDGDIDLVCLADGGTNLYWYSNTAGNGEPSFQRYTIGTNITRKFADMVIGDFNRDGSADLLFSDPLEGSIYHRSGLSGGNGFSSSATTMIAGGLMGVGQLEVIDFDQDGDLDCLAAIKGEGANNVTNANNQIYALYWLENTGNGFGQMTIPKRLFTTKKGIDSFKVGDLDGDRDYDIVVPQYHDNMICWYDNLANNRGFSQIIATNDWGVGGFFERPVVQNLSGPSAIDIGDFDGDGDLDIVAIARNESAIYLHLKQ